MVSVAPFVDSSLDSSAGIPLRPYRLKTSLADLESAFTSALRRPQGRRDGRKPKKRWSMTSASPEWR